MRVLTDTFGHTCARFFARAGALTEHRELALHLGIGQAFLYTPRAEWLDPAARWVEPSAPR